MNRPEEILKTTVELCRKRGLILPTYRQMRDPEQVPPSIRAELRSIGLWEVHPRNLFRITWKNEPVPRGGGFGPVNALQIPPELSGVPVHILVLLGKYFPTGAHKVGATFGPLVERLITGRFDPTRQKALWPSTGNYCRGGVYDSALLGCQSIAVLPEGMSRERFDWLREMGAEVIATPGSESNVKEIYDQVHRLLRERGDAIVNLNQFEDFGNPRWHYAVTGPAMEDVFHTRAADHSYLAGVFLTQGSGGTLGSAVYLRERFPAIKVGAGEALQCPTLLENGYGAHRIEGIGDKHVPWILNLKNLDLVAAIDDERVIRLFRLFQEPAGREVLAERGVDRDWLPALEQLGISGIANLVGTIAMAKYFEWDSRAVALTVATDSLELYRSRLEELREREGEYTPRQAERDAYRYLDGIGTDPLLELRYPDKKRMHNLKYFTWVEQQGKTVEELDRQWSDPEYWNQQFHCIDDWDEKIEAFNHRVGLVSD
ncbi:MAG: pyridoxal-phosphate dependent enzyme [Candidatus Neomarinimicrobiota bacterium]|nr:MAG: pyridoxal-phosphate dependent enzyme [Candidatus Neomarinimicrobiota bacterium]